jgi:hypothetical protein
MAEGKLIEVKAQKARYIRCYSKGSTADEQTTTSKSKSTANQQPREQSSGYNLEPQNSVQTES